MNELPREGKKEGGDAGNSQREGVLTALLGKPSPAAEREAKKVLKKMQSRFDDTWGARDGKDGRKLSDQEVSDLAGKHGRDVGQKKQARAMQIIMDGGDEGYQPTKSEVRVARDLLKAKARQSGKEVPPKIIEKFKKTERNAPN